MFCTCLGIPALQFLAAHIVAVFIVGGVTLVSGGLMVYDIRRNLHNQRVTYQPPPPPAPVKVVKRGTLHNDAWWELHGQPVITPEHHNRAAKNTVLEDYNRDANIMEQTQIANEPDWETALEHAWVNVEMREGNAFGDED